MISSYLSRKSRDDWKEEFIDEVTDELNLAHHECDLLMFYEMLHGLNFLDRSYL